MKRLLYPFLALFLLTGCGYRFSDTTRTAEFCKTVSIPYIEGDQDGSFTSTLIHTLAASGKWKYRPNQGELTLKVSLIETRNEEVGFARSVQNEQLNKWISPNENRLSTLVKVEMIETASQKTVLGPEYLSTGVIYDYDPDFNADNLVQFSLAQYNFQEISNRIAKAPLDERLSKIIIEFVENAW